MFLFQCETTFEADPALVWKIWTDVAAWPQWDPSREIAQLDGDLVAGSSGWAKRRGALGGSFTITAVTPGRRWVAESPIPSGKLIFDHSVEPLADGRVRVSKSADAEGGFVVLLRVMLAARMCRDTADSLAALEQEVGLQQSCR